MSERNSTLTQARLKSLLTYDAETGVFHWLQTQLRSKAKAGMLAGGLLKTGYWRIKIDGHTHKAHRLVWMYVHGRFPSAYLDHINGDTLDNRLINLREATNQENQQNIKRAFKSSSHGVLGASWNCQAEKWSARIKTEHKRVHLGYFDTAEQAGEAYINAKRVMHQFNTL